MVHGFGILVKEPVGIIKQPTVQDGFFDWLFDFWRAVVPGQNWFFDYSENCQSRFHYKPNLTHQFVVFESETIVDVKMVMQKALITSCLHTKMTDHTCTQLKA